MKRPLLIALSLLALCALQACMVTASTPGVYVYDPAPPAYYVYTYPDGCWADDVWHAPCPWSPGPSYGYYAYWHGGYYWQPHYRWSYRPGYPPPQQWRHYAPGRPYVPAHPWGGPRRRF